VRLYRAGRPLIVRAVATSRTIVVAGAGIGGLSAALALAGKGFRVSVFEQAARLEEAGAGIQLSPNATRILIALGLRERLTPHVVVPQALHVANAASGRDIVTLPLGEAERRYGAPYWMIHRGALQTALLEAARAHPDIMLRLGAKVDDCAAHPHGVTVHARSRSGAMLEEHGLGLVGADGIWSTLRARLGDRAPPRFRHRTAWRALVPTDAVAAEFRRPAVHLWLGPNGHLVHYPVQAGRLINVVAIVRDSWNKPGWSEPGSRDEVLNHFRAWAAPARDLLAVPEHWLKWALVDRPPLRRWGDGPVTLLGDAAHPTLPFLAQGAALAIEDAAVLARHMANCPDDPAGAMRRYEAARRSRTAAIQRAARGTERIYRLPPAAALLRNLAMRALGGDRLLARYDWIYRWRPG
jgi:salicylate hydroxylase